MAECSGDFSMTLRERYEEVLILRRLVRVLEMLRKCGHELQ
jgi:hypothetical protein